MSLTFKRDDGTEIAVGSDEHYAMRAPAPLPSFSGDDPVCVKCGNKGARTTYLGYGDCIHSEEGRVVTVGVWPNERLHRSCRRCDYAWDEATVETT